MLKRSGMLIMLICVMMVGVSTAASLPLSRDGFAPTLFTLTDPSTTVSGTLSGFPDVAYFTIEIPDSYQLDEIRLLQDENSDGGYWFAVMAGSQFTENSTSTSEITVANILGHVTTGRRYAAFGDNILSGMGEANGTIGFTGALPSGFYSFRVQNWGSGGDIAFEYVISSPTAVTLTSAAAANYSPILLITITLAMTTFITRLIPCPVRR